MTYKTDEIYAVSEMNLADIRFKFPDGTVVSLRELIADINTLKIKVLHLENAYMESQLMGKADDGKHTI